jgi:hypothetical protein
VASEHPGEPGDLPPSVQALPKIVAFLRHIDDELAAARHENCPDRLLAIVEEVPDLDQILGPLENALAGAARRLGVQPEPIDVRRRLLAPLHMLWADLIDMSAEQLRKHYGAHDVPGPWPELQRELLTAVENAIAELGDRPGPPPPTGPR